VTKEELEKSEIWQNMLYIESGGKIYTKADILVYIEKTSKEVAYAR
jgi:hypothetical protein